MTAELRRGGFAGRLLVLCDELRREGVALGTAEILDAVHALEAVPWTREVDIREALAATLAKSPEDRRVFDAVWARSYSAPSRRRPSSTPRARRSRAAGWGWTPPSCGRA